jgi:brefeldin A-inhibited guanine nucleotide-exchange protein
LANAPIGHDNSVYFSSPEETDTEQGIMMYMSFDQIILLVDCLVESHLFARKFNSNNEQRNLLWKAGQ